MGFRDCGSRGEGVGFRSRSWFREGSEGQVWFGRVQGLPALLWVQGPPRVVETQPCVRSEDSTAQMSGLEPRH